MRQVRRGAADTGKPLPRGARSHASNPEEASDTTGPRSQIWRSGPGGGEQSFAAGNAAGRELQRPAWLWALAHRAGDGSLPSGQEIARQYGRHERWGRLVKRSGTAGQFSSEPGELGLQIVGQQPSSNRKPLPPNTARRSCAASIELARVRISSRRDRVSRCGRQSEILWMPGAWPANYLAAGVLSQVNLNGKIVTADALHTVTATAEFICGQGPARAGRACGADHRRGWRSGRGSARWMRRAEGE